MTNDCSSPINPKKVRCQSKMLSGEHERQNLFVLFEFFLSFTLLWL